MTNYPLSSRLLSKGTYDRREGPQWSADQLWIYQERTSCQYTRLSAKTEKPFGKLASDRECRPTKLALHGEASGELDSMYRVKPSTSAMSLGVHLALSLSLTSNLFRIENNNWLIADFLCWCMFRVNATRVAVHWSCNRISHISIFHLGGSVSDHLINRHIVVAPAMGVPACHNAPFDTVCARLEWLKCGKVTHQGQVTG